MVSTLSCHTPAQSPSSLPCQKSTPYKMRVVFVSLSMQSGQEVAHLVPTMTLSPPSLAATMCVSPCGWLHPPPSLPPFLLTQNPRPSTWRPSFLCSAQCDVVSYPDPSSTLQEVRGIWWTQYNIFVPPLPPPNWLPYHKTLGGSGNETKCDVTSTHTHTVLKLLSHV